MIGTLGEPHTGERLHGLLFVVFATDGTGHHHIFERGELRQKMVVLKNIANALVAEARLCRPRETVKVGAIDDDFALLRRFQTRQCVEQCRLARATGAAKKYFFTCGDFQIDLTEHSEGFFS